jgi:hypothetical protein
MDTKIGGTMRNIRFQYYPGNIKVTQPAGWLTLDYLLTSTRSPKPHVIDTFNRIAEAESAGNMKLKAELKQNNLYFFTPCVHVKEKRRYKDIIQWTGLMGLDFDHISNASDFKQAIFFEYKYIIAAWLSPSKRGVKALVKIPICSSVLEFKERFNALSFEMDMYNGFDTAPKNCVLPLFQSFDPELLHRDNPHTFTGREKLTDVFDPSTAPDPGFVFNSDNHKHKGRIIKMIDSGMSKITSNGHPQLRGLCVAVGGYVAAGYISEHEAREYLHHKISYHNYLSKGTRGYQKTADQMLGYGQQKPLAL